MIESFKVYVLVVALSINDNIKFLENIKQGFKKKNFLEQKYTEITTQTSHQVYGIIIETKFIILTIILHMVNHLNIKK